VIGLAPDEWKTEMGTIADAGDPNDTGGKRLYYWGIGWRMFLDHPILGVGTENFGKRAPEYRDRDRYNESMWKRVSHSLYFTLLPEHGLVGTFIYFMMIWTCVRGHRRLQRRYRDSPGDETLRTTAQLSSGFVAALAATLITGTFVSVLYYPSGWVLCCMIGSLVDIADAEAARSSSAAMEVRP
jgi:O-antigen ligase